VGDIFQWFSSEWQISKLSRVFWNYTLDIFHGKDTAIFRGVFAGGLTLSSDPGGH